MFEELNILNNLYELQKSINDKDDLILINNLIEKREKGFLNLKNNLLISKKDFSSNSKTVKKIFIDIIGYETKEWTESLEEKLNLFLKSNEYKTLVILRFNVNKMNCTLKNQARETLNLYTIETIKKTLKL